MTSDGQALADRATQGMILAASWMDKKARALTCGRLTELDFIGRDDRELLKVLLSVDGKFDWLAAERNLSPDAKERLIALQRDFLRVPNVDVFCGWLETVKKHTALRLLRVALEGLGTRIKPGADPDALVADAIVNLIGVRGRAASCHSLEAEDALKGALEIIEAWKEGDVFKDSVPTGFASLDRVLGGMLRGHVCVLGARPGVGKTQLAVQIARNVALRAKAEKREARVVIFSAEMTAPRLIMRLAACASGIETDALRFGKATEIERARYIQAAEALRPLSMLIDPSPAPTTTEMLHRVRAEVAMHKDGVDLVVLDYIELAGDKGDQEVTRLGMVMKGLKTVAKENNCPVLALSQLSRKVEERAERMPRLSDLRFSGDLEALAQQVIFIYRPEAYRSPSGEYPTDALQTAAKRLGKNGVALVVAKNRDGKTGPVKMRFTPEITRFAELEDKAA